MHVIIRPIATHEAEWSVGLSVCHDRELRKTAEPIEMPFGTWTRVGSRNRVLDGSLDRHA